MRHFYRCKICLSVMATDERIVAEYDEKYNQLFPKCGLCDGYIEYMGEVNNGKLVKYENACPCDGRCTGATGPVCECQCGGANHGSNKVVKVTKVQGNIPVLQMPNDEKALAVAREFNQAMEQAKSKLSQLPYYEAFSKGNWIADKNAWWRIENAKRRIADAKKCKVHKTRMKKLAEIQF